MKTDRVISVRNSEKGFTLIEILIAITIFAVGMLAVASMQISGIQGNATAKALTGGASWAADRVERLIASSYDDPDLAAGVHPDQEEGRYTISWNVTDNAPINGVKTVAVTVAWEDRGKTKSMTLNYYKTTIY